MQVVLNADLSRVTVRWALPTPLRGHVRGVSESWLAPDEFEEDDTRRLEASNEPGYKVRTVTHNTSTLWVWGGSSSSPLAPMHASCCARC